MKVEQQQSFSVIGVTIRTNNQAEMSANGKINPLWQNFMAKDLAAQIPHRADENLLAVYSDYASDQNGDYNYSIAARVTSTDDVPAGFTALTVPAGRYAIVTTGRGPVQTILPAVWKRIWSASPAELGGERVFKTDYEVYPPGTNPQDAQATVHVGLK